MNRLRVFVLAVAFGVALWATADMRSLLLAFLMALALLAIAVGIGMVLGDLDRPAPRRTEKELYEIQFHEYLRALDHAANRRHQI